LLGLLSRGEQKYQRLIYTSLTSTLQHSNTSTLSLSKPPGQTFNLSVNMKYPLIILFPLILLACTVEPDQQDSLVSDKYTEVPLRSIKPEGWLRHQLEIMRDGSTGHLDEIHPKLSNDNGWLGGK